MIPLTLLGFLLLATSAVADEGWPLALFGFILLLISTSIFVDTVLA